MIAVWESETWTLPTIRDTGSAGELDYDDHDDHHDYDHDHDHDDHGDHPDESKMYLDLSYKSRKTV